MFAAESGANSACHPYRGLRLINSTNYLDTNRVLARAPSEIEALGPVVALARVDTHLLIVEGPPAKGRRSEVRERSLA
jgi:hypothetical protein